MDARAMDALEIELEIIELEIEITPAMREKLDDFIQLHDFYGSLLTERQNVCFSMHYLEDLSLTEIGGVLAITPQAVADQLKRTLGILRRYEEKLGLLRNWRKQQAQLKRIHNALAALQAEGYPMEAPIEEIKVMMEDID